MTKSQYEALKEFEANMRTAQKYGWSRNISPTLRKRRFISLYTSITGEKKPVMVNCHTCIIGMLKKLADLYFNYTPEVEQKPKANATKNKAKRQRQVRKGEEDRGDDSQGMVEEVPEDIH